MKSLQNLLNKYTTLLLVCFCLFAVFLHFQNWNFPCFNSDEASFAYNGFSIAETGKDEYGKTMPSRFKAFGENKLPVTIYTIAAFVKVFGLSEFTSRLPFILIGILSPILFYLFAKKLFNNNIIGLIAAFFASLSPWIQIMSRHIHENLIIMFLTFAAMFVVMKLMKKFMWKDVIWLAVIAGISLFTYHIGKLLAGYFLILLVAVMISQKQKMMIIVKALLIFMIPVVIFLFTEMQNPTTRVNNLLFINNSGFISSIEELRREDDTRLVHNKVTKSIITLTNKYLTYFSPEFLVIKGDANERFGMTGFSPISAVEFMLFILGLFYLFANKEKYRFLILSLLLVTPLSASLSWQDYSLTRSFLMIIPILIPAAYGLYNIVTKIHNKNIANLTLVIIFGAYGYFTFYSWDFYFNHYPKRKEAIFAWQCGYKELNSIIKESYDSTDRFYITKKLGQPYIFTLFYMKFPPAEYQKQANLTELGEYGFGEVEKFDKFIFDFKQPDEKESAVYIGYPEDFGSDKDVKKITINGEDIFWIYKTN